MKCIVEMTYEEVMQNINKDCINDTIKPHTVDKIHYVKEYVTNWLYVMTRISTEIFFIDCMSNAGVYKNGYFCSCIEVLKVFYSFAINNPNINFHLYCNDYNVKKIETLKQVKNVFVAKYKYINNVKFEIYNCDATKFINDLSKMLNTSIKKSILLYVDPYNFVTKELLDQIYNFTSKIYSEVILNFFSSDITRNIKNFNAYKKREAFEKVVSNYTPYDKDEDVNANQLMYYIIEKFIESTNLKYKYVFQIKNTKNVEQYYLIYFTPNITGLSKLKNSVWKLFGPSINNKMQENLDRFDLFGNTSLDYIMMDNLNKVKEILNNQIGKTLSFNEIETIVLEDTLLTESHVITYIIKPLINEGLLVKQNFKSKRDFKNDYYKVVKSIEMKGFFEEWNQE